VGFELYCQLLKQSVSALKGEKVKPRIEVAVRLDFLALHPGDERSNDGSVAESQGLETRAATPAKDGAKAKGRRGKNRPDDEDWAISVPRDSAVWISHDRPSSDDEPRTDEAEAIQTAPAYIPLRYVKEPHQRIELYRKLAQASDKADLDRLRGELRDRFGKLPASVELLLDVSELKLLAAERRVSALETKGDRLMISRNNDYITVGGKFPRLTKKEARARLKEIKRLLLVL
jgi:transcription-repair coupling factor (superfamily II helicase)